MPFRGLDLDRTGFHSYGFREVTNFQCNVVAHSRGNFKLDALHRIGFETRLINADIVDAHGQVLGAEVARRVGGDVVVDASSLVDDFDQTFGIAACEVSVNVPSIDPVVCANAICRPREISRAAEKRRKIRARTISNTEPPGAGIV